MGGAWCLFIVLVRLLRSLLPCLLVCGCWRRVVGMVGLRVVYGECLSGCLSFLACLWSLVFLLCSPSNRLNSLAFPPRAPFRDCGGPCPPRGGRGSPAWRPCRDVAGVETGRRWAKLGKHTKALVLVVSVVSVLVVRVYIGAAWPLGGVFRFGPGSLFRLLCV